MNRVAKLKSAAIGLAGIGAGISSEKLIAKNKRTKRARQGWDTRRRSMQKNASELSTVARAVIASDGSVRSAATEYAARKALEAIRGKHEDKPVSKKS